VERHSSVGYGGVDGGTRCAIERCDERAVKRRIQVDGISATGDRGAMDEAANMSCQVDFP
jgi:hypothetical protein